MARTNVTYRPKLRIFPFRVPTQYLPLDYVEIGIAKGAHLT